MTSMPDEKKDKLLRVAVLAKRWDVSVSTIYRLIESGDLKSTTVGVKKGIRVYESSAVKFEAQRSALAEAAA